MEAIATLIGLAVVGALIVLPIWLAASISNLRRRLDDEHRDNLQHRQDLSARLHILENQLKELQHSPPTPATSVTAPTAVPAEEIRTTVRVTTPAADVAPVKIVTPPVAAPPLIPPQPPQPPRAEVKPEEPAAATPPPPPPLPPAPARTPYVPVQPRPTPVAQTPPATQRSGIDLEEMLGTNWLNKIGIGILVLGLAFFLAYQLQNLGPAGKSQTTTALAFVLSYLTVGIHHTSFYSLIASVILAATVVTLALRMQWFALEIFGILATYLNHFLWVSPVIEGMGPNRVEFPEFRLSILLLAFYWLLFRLSYIYRRVDNEEEEKLSTTAALLNGFCLLALLKYQSVHPEWAFWALLTLGAVELGLSALAARRRRMAFIVLATLGSALLIAAVPFRYSGSDLSMLWLIGAETFLLAGVFTREIVFRRIGLVTLLIVAGQMIFFTGASLLELRLSDNSNALADYPTALLFAVGAFLCYLNSHWVGDRWPELFKLELDDSILQLLTYVGGLLALLGEWFAFPGMSTAVVWAAMALLLGVAGKQFARPALAIQGNFVALAAIARLITLNLFSTEQWHGISLRLITVGATALLLYAAAPFARSADRDKDEDGPWSVFTAAYTWAASILLGALIWYEVAPLNVAIAWMLLGLVLLEIGLTPQAGFLRWQSYTALTAAFLQIAFVNLQAVAVAGQTNPRISRVLPLAAAYYYADWRLRLAGKTNPQLQRSGTFFTYLGTITLAALLYYELLDPFLAAGWAALALLAIASAFALKRRDYLHQSFLLAAAVAFRVVTYNFFRPDSAAAPFVESRSFFVGTAIAFLFAALPFAFALRRANSQNSATFPLERRPEQVFFFVPFTLLTILVAQESTRGQLTVNWGIEGMVIFLFAVWVGERSFRLSGLGLLLACAAKIFLIDVWGLDPQSKYITLIALGAALVLVSYLYTRYKEKFRQYL